MLALLSPFIFNPVTLFGASDSGGIWDASNVASLFQLSGGTTAVTTTGDPVGRMTDLSGKGIHQLQTTAGARPTWNSAGYIETNGTTQFIFATTTWTAARTAVVAFQSLSAAASRIRLFGRDALNAFNDDTNNAIWYAKNVSTQAVMSRTPRGRPYVFAVRRISDSVEELWWNGQLILTIDPTDSSTPGFFALGADGGFGTNKGAAKFYWAMDINRALTDAELRQANLYAAAKIRSTRFGPCDIIVAAGQSNTYFATPIDSTLDVGDANLYEFAQNGEILLAVDPLDTYAGRTPNYIGHLMQFARDYIAAGKVTAGRKLMVVHCGLGGTGFSTAAPDTWSIATGSLRARTINRVNAALEATPGSTVKAFVWLQGESDAQAGVPWTTNHQANLTSLFFDFRQGINGQAIDATILVGGMVPGWVANIAGPGGAIVQAVLEGAGGFLTKAAYYSSAGLTGQSGPNDLHFDPASQRTLGHRAFADYDALD